MSVATRTNVRNVADCGLSVFWVVGLEKQALQRRIDAGTFGPILPFNISVCSVMLVRENEH